MSSKTVTLSKTLLWTKLENQLGPLLRITEISFNHFPPPKMDDPRFIVLLLSLPLNKPVIKKGKKCKVLPDLDFNHLLCLLKTVSAWLLCVSSWWLCHFAVAGHTFLNPERVSEKFESGTWWVTFIKDTRCFCSLIIHCNNTCVCVQQ